MLKSLYPLISDRYIPMKRFIFTAVLAVLLLVPVLTVSAATVYTEGTLYYTVENGSVTITGYFGRETEVTVPSQIAGMPVNTIAAGAFADEKETAVTLPDSVTTVEQGAFDETDTVIWAGSDDSQQDSDAEKQPEQNNTQSNTENTGSNNTAQGSSSVYTQSNTQNNNTTGNDDDDSASEKPVGTDEAEVIMEDAESDVAEEEEPLYESEDDHNPAETMKPRSAGIRRVLLFAGIAAVALFCIFGIAAIVRRRQEEE